MPGEGERKFNPAEGDAERLGEAQQGHKDFLAGNPSHYELRAMERDVKTDLVRPEAPGGYRKEGGDHAPYLRFVTDHQTRVGDTRKAKDIAEEMQRAVPDISYFDRAEAQRRLGDKRSLYDIARGLWAEDHKEEEAA